MPCIADASFFYDLMNSEPWLQHIGDRGIISDEKAIEYIESLIDKHQTIGYSLYVMTKNEIAIGVCGLLKREYLNHPDLGFALLPEFTGKGYVQEASIHILNHAFENLKLDKVLAITSPHNSSSQSTLESLGFITTGSIHTPDKGEALLYEKQKK